MPRKLHIFKTPSDELCCCSTASAPPSLWLPENKYCWSPTPSDLLLHPSQVCLVTSFTPGGSKSLRANGYGSQVCLLDDGREAVSVFCLSHVRGLILSHLESPEGVGPKSGAEVLMIHKQRKDDVMAAAKTFQLDAG